MIKILYTCDLCGIKDAEVEVRERGDEEDIRDWMQALTVAAGVDHAHKSPLCHPGTLTNVKIPISPSGGRIGDPTSH